ncbi:hypothetical protein HanIR_Chr10g0454391 [Helianthus annuus]|nr:hypothetical protein HanIR_Chr10g0454391 [Helianthus annuus]
MCKKVCKRKNLCYWASGHGPLLDEHDPVFRVHVTKTYRRWTRGRVGWARPRFWQKICRIKQTAGLGKWARGRVGRTLPRVDNLQR